MLRMTDIAARAGVSQTTVSFVLNGRETSVRISETTRQRVLAAAEEMGYRSNHLARAIRTGNTRTLGFIGGDLCSEHVGLMLDGALEEAEKSGFNLKILPHREGDNGMDAIVRRSSELRLSGVAALHLPLELLQSLRAETSRYGYGMVLLDTPAALAEVPQVATDDENGVSLVVNHLVELGHTRIAMISSDPISVVAILREQAFRDAMSRCGLDVPENFIGRGDFRLREPSVAAARALLLLPAAERPTAIFCSGDLIGCVAIQVAHQLGLVVPRDLSVVGFGDLRVSRFVVPPLTTIHQPFREMGRCAVQRLISDAQNDTRSSAKDENGSAKARRAQTRNRDTDVGDGRFENACPRKLLAIHLVERESTGPPPASISRH